ncbi:MAG TPA: protocatechuate 3,4-dioxygenase subunit alpha [Burkholderiaceae bacterium]
MTGSQTVGPFLHIGLADLYCDKLITGEASDTIVIAGQVLDGDGNPIPDGMLEIWQADARGVYSDPQDGRTAIAGFRGFGRVATDKEGRFAFTTIKPGKVPGPDGRGQAPHIMVSVFMRGLIKRLATRLYFPDEAANEADPILQLVPAERRATLIARAAAVRRYEWDVIIQAGPHGRAETVFFDV